MPTVVFMIGAGFPSPCGEKVGINTILLDKGVRRPSLGAFPSPCGEKVGINLH